MRRYLVVSILFLCSHAQAETPCFDLIQNSVKLLRPAPTSFKPKSDSTDFGTDAKENDWGQISGTVEKPILDLYRKLQDPKTIRNGDNTRVDVTVIQAKDFLKKIVEKIVVKPVFFITIEWTEEWAFGLKKGSADKPQEIVISYQKSEGTSHIKHLCGNILLQSLTPTSTGVYIYEEVQADRRTAEDVLKGITGTLRTLRE